MIGKLLKASATLLVLNIGAGLINYAYQIIAARRLDVAELGRLNVLLVGYGLALGAALIVQYWPVFRGGRSAQLKAHWIRSWYLVAASAGFFAVAASLSGGGSSTWSVAVLTAGVVTTLGLHYWLGVLQSRKAFLAFGLLGVLLAIFKFGGSLAAGSVFAFATAVAVSPLFALIAALLTARREVSASSVPPATDDAAGPAAPLTQALIFPAVTGLAFVLLPSYDLINVRAWLGEEPAGHLARLQLFSKILFFAPVTLIQVTLPHYVQAFRTQGNSAEATTLRRIESLGLAASYAGAFAFGALGPWISESILGIPRLGGTEVLLACLAIPPLYGILSSLHVFAAAGRTRAMLWVLGLSALSPLGAALLHWDNLREYLAYSASINTVLGVGAHWLVRRALGGARTQEATACA